MDAFVEPETLEGDNQYFCERCNKKCDAHKVRYQLPAVEQSLLNQLFSSGFKVQEVSILADSAVEEV